MLAHLRPSALLAGLALLAPPAAHAATVTWPGSPGCTGTLQACVDRALPGDTVLVRTDVAPTDPAPIVLRRGIRISGVTAGRQPPRIPQLRLEAGTGTARVALHDLDIDTLDVAAAAVDADLELGLHRLHVRRHVIVAAESQQSIALQATGNVFHGGGFGVTAEGAAFVALDLEGNRFEGPRLWSTVLGDYDARCGIALASQGQARMSADLDGNAVRCEFDSALYVAGFSSAPLVVRADNLAIALQDPLPGRTQPNGRALEVVGHVEVRLAHATINRGLLRLGCGLADCASPRIEIFNSILANLSVEPTGPLRIEYGGNLHFRTPALPGVDRGGNAAGDPRFRAIDDLRLRPDSPAIGIGLDLGDELQFGEGGAVLSDFDGLPRDPGRRPDAGAFAHGDVEGPARIPAGAGGIAMPARYRLDRPLFTSPAAYTGADRNVQPLALLEPGAGWIVLRSPDSSSGAIDVHAWQPSGLVVTESVGRTATTADVGISAVARGRIVILREAGVDGSPVFGQTLGLRDSDGEWLATSGNHPGARMIPAGLQVASLLLEPGAHAFEQVADASNLDAFGDMRISHRDLDDSPCAPVHVTPVHPFAGTFRVIPRDVGGRKGWYLRRSDAIGGIVPGQRFHLFVHREAMTRCTEPAQFADGFE